MKLLVRLQTYQHPNQREARKEKRQRKKLQTYLKKITKEIIPNLVKEIDIQVQKAQRVPNKLDPKRNIPRHIIIKMPKVKDKETLKSTNRKAESYLQRSSCRVST